MFSSDKVKKNKKAIHIAKALFKTVSGKAVIHNLNINVTNACNQACPACNARLSIKEAETMKAKDLKKYLERLKPNLPATATISGGEPTLASELSEIIEISKEYFPFGAGLSSNFYGHTKPVRDNLVAALRANIRISASLDGLSNESNKQRGVPDAWQKTVENIKFVTEKKKELKSKSPLIIHTVISDLNINELPGIVKFSKEMGWIQRIAPLQSYSYQGHDNSTLLSYSSNLEKKLAEVIKEKHARQNKAFVNGIVLFAQNKHPKLCPYLKKGMRFLKVFLDPNGDISLCNRVSLGNLNRENSFDEIMNSDGYRHFLGHCEQCRGCWTSCFVEPVLYAKPILKRKLTKIKV